MLKIIFLFIIIIDNRIWTVDCAIIRNFMDSIETYMERKLLEIANKFKKDTCIEPNQHEIDIEFYKMIQKYEPIIQNINIHSFHSIKKNLSIVDYTSVKFNGTVVQTFTNVPHYGSCPTQTMIINDPRLYPRLHLITVPLSFDTKHLEFYVNLNYNCKMVKRIVPVLMKNCDVNGELFKYKPVLIEFPTFVNLLAWSK